jgi:hypothetical protein
LQVAPVHQQLPEVQHSSDEAAPNVAATQAEEQSQLIEKQAEHLTAGKSAVWDVVELYKRMCRAIVPLVLCNLLYYAMWSYCVPNLFCKTAIKNSRVGHCSILPLFAVPGAMACCDSTSTTSLSPQGTNVSFTDCVYVTDGDYKAHPRRTIPFLIFYMVQWTWQTVVPYWFGAALFGAHNFAWYEWFLMISVNLVVALTTAVGTTYQHWAINKPILQLFLPGGHQGPVTSRSHSNRLCVLCARTMLDLLTA